MKGKAAIDVLGARLGKSGGALAQQVTDLHCNPTWILYKFHMLIRESRMSVYL